MSAEIIKVDFQLRKRVVEEKPKEKIEKVIDYQCLVCNKTVNKSPMIALGNNTDCICKDCSLDIHAIVAEQKSKD